MIGQFIRLYFTVWTAEFKSLFEVKSSPSICNKRYDKHLTNLVFLVCTVSYRLYKVQFYQGATKDISLFF